MNGILMFSETSLSREFFKVLQTFVSINKLLYFVVDLVL